MKRPFFIILYMFVLILLIPSLLTIFIYKDHLFDGNNIAKVIPKINSKQPNIQIYNSTNDKVESVNIEEYLYNVVAAEMPANFNEEALKAQAIAARSYAFYKMDNGGEKIPQHKGGVVCTDFRHCQAYLPEDELKKAHGEKWMKELWPKVKKSVDDTTGMVLTYDKKVIQPLYHSTSGGRTENSEEVFSSALPYLKSVESPYEEGSPKLISNLKMSKSDFENKFKSKFKDIQFSQNIEGEIKIISKSKGGSVKEIKIGNKVLKGRDVRTILGLNSSDFEIKVTGSGVDIVTKGYGHGVGMSQWGANGMASRGKKYDEILKHYFTGVKIESRY